MLLFRTRLHHTIGDMQVSRDDSRIIYSIRPDGSQLTELVKSGDDCERFKPIPPDGSHPLWPRLSPDGQQILFLNEVREWDEELRENLLHFYLSMIPVTGGPIVRLEEIGGYHNAEWSEDGASIYYYSGQSSDETWRYVPRRYELETGRSQFLTDELWEAYWGFSVSRADGALCFIAKQGFARLDPDTGIAELVSEERLDTFDLSPDGRRAAGVKEGDVMIVNLEFPSSAPLQVEPGAVDALELGQIPATRKKWALQRGYSALRQLPSEARKSTGVQRIRWLDKRCSD